MIFHHNNKYTFFEPRRTFAHGPSEQAPKAQGMEKMTTKKGAENLAHVGKVLQVEEHVVQKLVLDIPGQLSDAFQDGFSGVQQSFQDNFTNALKKLNRNKSVQMWNVLLSEDLEAVKELFDASPFGGGRDISSYVEPLL